MNSGDLDVGGDARASETAYDSLLEQIVSLELAPGSLWSETSLAKRLGLGRTPVREALQRLASAHLVTSYRRHGVLISDVNGLDQLLILETRRELEKLAARAATRRATDRERENLLAIANAIVHDANQKDTAAYIRDIFGLKAAIVETGRNRYTQEALEPLLIQSRRFFFMHLRQVYDMTRVAILHQDLARTIAEGDGDKAVEASEAIYQFTVNFTREIVTDSL